MPAHQHPVIRVFTLSCLAVLVQGSLLQAGTATWTPTGSLVEARSGSAAALLSDGRILFTGGTGINGALATAEFFSTDGSFAPGSPMQDPRTGHTAVLLKDGRVLVAGGTTVGGTITNTAEIYDASANSWTPVAGGMTIARSGHTASVLSDGRVLIAGGQSTNGATNILEIFSPATGSFSTVSSGTLSSPRQQHAAAVLQDDRVLIAGGSDGTNALSTSDIFDPSSGAISAGPRMSAPRAGLSATTLLDGKVLIAGGNNGTADLASAEIYDPAAGTFSGTGSLTVGRSSHVAFLLPDNNEVLIAGGTSDGTALQTAELFVPWTGSFAATGAMATARTAAAGSALKQEGQLLLAAGTDGQNPLGSGERYSFATVKTDQADYPPGTTVNITGSGWQPGETVTLTLVESPLFDTHGPYTAVADSNGRISNSQFITDASDASIQFYLTAKGSVSQARNTFTDGNVTSVSGKVRDNSGNPISGATIACTSGCNNNPQASTSSGSDGSYIFNNSTTKLAFATNGPVTIQLTASKSGYTSATITLLSVNNGDTLSGKDFALTPSSVATTTNVTSSLNPSTFGQAVTFTATVTSASGTPTGSVTFYDGGSCATPGTSLTSALPLNGSGAAGFSTSALTTATHTILACYTPTGTFTGGTGSVPQQVKQGNATVTLGNLSQTYDGTPKSATASTTPAGLTVTFTYNGASTAPTAVGSYTVVGTVQDTNYQGSATGTLTINPATPTVTVTGGPFTYDGTAHGASAAATGIGGATVSGTSTFSYSPGATTPVNAGTYTVTATFTSTDPNYTNASGNGSITINQATPTLTVTGLTTTYDATAHPATVTITGVSGDTSLTASSVTLTYTPGGASGPVNAGSYTVIGNFPGNQNYKPVTSSQATITINQATPTLTVTGLTTTYDATAHPATVTITGVSGDNSLTTSLVTLTYTPAASTAPVNAGTYTVVANFPGTQNYTAVTSSQATIIINKATPALTVTGLTTTYDATAHSATVTITGVSGDSSLNASSVTLTYTLGGPAPVNAGQYTVIGSFPGNQNYNPVTSSPATIIINKATPALTVTGLATTYDATAHPATVTITGVSGAYSLTASLVTLTYTPGGSSAPVNAGNYTVLGNFGGTQNYNPVTSSLATITINKATPALIVAGGTYLYDGIPHGSTATATGIGGATVQGTFTFTYSSGTPPVHAGMYAVSVRFDSADPNYTYAAGAGTLTISPAPTATAVTSSLNQSGGTVTVTVTATVTNTATLIAPSGTVAFADTYGPLDPNKSTTSCLSGTSTLTCQLTLSGLATGTAHVISATYTPILATPDFTTSASGQNTAPAITITAPVSGNVQAVNTSLNLSATFTDTDTLHPSAEWTFTDTGSNTSTSTAGTVSTSSIGGLSTLTAPGVYAVTLTFTDGLGGIAIANTVSSPNAPANLPATIVIYDPSAGFVTGGGWINSPVGAYAANPSLTGKATFGFVSKYQKGATVPTGDTEFQFQVGNFEFHSNTYQWLVISGGLAQYKGTGTINGAGTYNFLLTGRDGALYSPGTPDGFRIKITDPSGSSIYDNMVSSSDTMTSGNTETLGDNGVGGGSIIVHSK